MGRAGVMGVDRAPTPLIAKRGSQLEGAITCIRLVEKCWGTEAIPLQAICRTVKQTIYGGQRCHIYCISIPRSEGRSR
jgi:hypothetical protein